MSILASLVQAYERLPNAPAPGYSTEKVGFVISLDANGRIAHLSDLRIADGKKLSPRPMLVPQPVKRTVAPASNSLWDKTSYALGVTAGEGKRTADEHAKFVAHQEELLAGATDEGLAAFLAFLRDWRPERFAELGWPDDLKDQNVVFALESERRNGVYLHDRPAAKEALARMTGQKSGSPQICLVTGKPGPVARLHPSIKGVWGAQSSGAALISFNLDAFKSYGHEQGDNAPVGEYAAFAYTTMLNLFLERGSGHRIQVGDASTVFWADSRDAVAAASAESLFREMIDPQSPDEAEAAAVEEEQAANAGATRQIADKLRRLTQGEPLTEVEPALADGVRFYVLGLAPNAARLSVRFYVEDDFGVIARRYLEHVERMRIEPPPRGAAPSMWRLLIETASQRKSENIPPQLAGDWLRAILAGTQYPLTLLSVVLMRIRADHDVNALRVSIIKAVLVNNFEMKQEAPVALDPENSNPAYLLGRLFAVLEKTQHLALGNVNASIKDRYYGSASATPRSVFPLLLRMNVHHQSKALGNSKGLAGYFASQLSEIMNAFPAEFPAILSLQSQGAFALGYFHQMNRRKSSDADEPATVSEEQL
ncbi:type I-C CRISPR-associated protein Cas8c/Csd1 [Methylocystis parvus]|uniref:Type I-C CRISPR-associated protein Cas8c/Csd1 n=1 Tax=Methylocystis parvus TaxID=134 RepID=A0A6B8M2Q7_9HYPH|nr:type I-C CRISPR-associated protein Cas8c/Csd1 [Methylocystis parvus]QGM98094.1 type I-C CRISPR-associated protein Cas8c/Csd1 [Methylocystis parvus]WBK01585.1 type I-C CRISPR-associated protein Cas8c/Csd1 [Methylocystis parvus OBBP]